MCASCRALWPDDPVVLERAVPAPKEAGRFTPSTATKLLLVRPIKGLRRSKQVRVRIGHERDGGDHAKQTIQTHQNPQLGSGISASAHGRSHSGSAYK